MRSSKELRPSTWFDLLDILDFRILVELPVEHLPIDAEIVCGVDKFSFHERLKEVKSQLQRTTLMTSERLREDPLSELIVVERSIAVVFESHLSQSLDDCLHVEWWVFGGVAESHQSLHALSREMLRLEVERLNAQIVLVRARDLSLFGFHGSEIAGGHKDGHWNIAGTEVRCFSNIDRLRIIVEHNSAQWLW